MYLTGLTSKMLCIGPLVVANTQTSEGRIVEDFYLFAAYKQILQDPAAS